MNGELLVDFIGRLENFDADLRKVCERTGIELETVPHKNRSDHTHYRELYTPETEQIVRRGSGATSNTSATSSRGRKPTERFAKGPKTSGNYQPKSLPRRS